MLETIDSNTHFALYEITQMEIINIAGTVLTHSISTESNQYATFISDSSVIEFCISPLFCISAFATHGVCM